MSVTALPLNSLVKSPKNVRQNPGDVSALAASIASQGLLQNLVVSATGDGLYQVDAGGRRLAALTLLAEQGKIPADYQVQVKLIDAGDSVSASLSENVQRESMNPVDELAAFKQLVDDGFTIDSIADVHGVTPLVVERRLKLVAAAPELLEVYRSGEITTDQMIALCATDDHEVQRTVWNTHGQHYWSNKPADLRRYVLAQDVQADRDYRVAFIGGVAPYEDAGGDVRRDLFSTDGQGAILTNPALLDEMVAAKLDGEADTLRAEGWGWVEVWNSWDSTAFARLGTLPAPDVAELPAEAIVKIHAVTAEKETLAKEQEELHAAAEAEDRDLTDEEYDRDNAIDERLEAIVSEIANIESAHSAYSSEIKTNAGVVVCLTSSGLRIERGQVRAADRKLIADALGDAGSIKGGRETESAGRKTDAVSDALRRSLLGHRNVAVQEVASQNVSAMKILQACWTVKELRTGYNDAPTNFLISSSGSGTRNGYPISDDAGVAKADAFRKSCSDAVKDLPTADEKLWDELSEMKPAQLDRIIALGVALSISLNAEHKGLTAKLLDTLGFDMAEHFRPTADNYLGRVPKLLVIEALTEAKRMNGTADTLLGMKKGVLAEEAEIRMAGSGWVPKGIRTPKAPTKGKTPSKAAALKSKAKVPAQAITSAAALA